MRHLLRLTILVVTVAAQAAPALAEAPSAPSTGETQLAAFLGEVFAAGTDDFDGAAGFGAFIQRTWRVGTSFRLGVRETLSVASLPFGSNDGEPVPLERSGYAPQYFKYVPTFFPATAFVVSVAVGNGVRFDLASGFYLMVSSELGVRSLIPMPTILDAGVEVMLSRSLALRLELDVRPIGFTHPAMFLPHWGLAWSF